MKLLVALCAAGLFHLSLVALLMAEGGAAGLRVRRDSVGEGMLVSLAPSASATTSTSASASQTPPASVTPIAMTTPTSPPESDLESQKLNKADDIDDAQASTPSPASGAPTATSKLDGKVAAPPPPAKALSLDPWSQASFEGGDATDASSDLWPQIAPCWRDMGSAEQIRLSVLLDSHGKVLSSDVLNGAGGLEAFADISPVEEAARAAVAACGPYRTAGGASSHDVVFPARLKAADHGTPSLRSAR